jgi:hypothetical protein
VKLFAIVAALVCTAGCASTYATPPEVSAGVDGSTTGHVQISSGPTVAWIFIDGAYVGLTPLEQELNYQSGTRFVEVVAVPLYEAQARQVKRIQVPPLPQSLFFNMNNPPASAASN